MFSHNRSRIPSRSPASLLGLEAWAFWHMLARSISRTMPQQVPNGQPRPRLFAPAETRDRAVVGLDCIGIADIARVPQDLDAGQ